MAKTVSEGSANKAIPISAGFLSSGARGPPLQPERQNGADALGCRASGDEADNIVAVALAKKMARIVWALMATGRRFEAAPAL